MVKTRRPPPDLAECEGCGFEQEIDPIQVNGRWVTPEPQEVGWSLDEGLAPLCPTCTKKWESLFVSAEELAYMAGCDVAAVQAAEQAGVLSSVGDPPTFSLYDYDQREWLFNRRDKELPDDYEELADLADLYDMLELNPYASTKEG